MGSQIPKSGPNFTNSLRRGCRAEGEQPLHLASELLARGVACSTRAVSLR